MKEELTMFGHCEMSDVGTLPHRALGWEMVTAVNASIAIFLHLVTAQRGKEVLATVVLVQSSWGRAKGAPVEAKHTIPQSEKTISFSVAQ